MRSLSPVCGALVVVGCLSAACGGSSGGGKGFGSVDGGSSSGGSGSGGSNGGSGSSSGGVFGGDDGGGSSSGGNDCSGAASDFVYVLSAENALYSFAPNTKTFTKIGTLDCTSSMQPNSMAVDRNAVAYVNYVKSNAVTGKDTAGAIFKVSTTDASCQGELMPLPSGWYRIGMGYSSDSAGGTTETLYVNGVGNGVTTGGGAGLGIVDFAKTTVNPVGPFTGNLAGQSAELTGTGDGRLFGFFTTTPVYVAQVDKTTGATANPVPMTGVMTPLAWAFSFWGGHFYLYTSQGQGTGNGSDVTDYDPVSGTINTSFMKGIGFDIVGAGVSTCAPTTGAQ